MYTRSLVQHLSERDGFVEQGEVAGSRSCSMADQSTLSEYDHVEQQDQKLEDQQADEDQDQEPDLDRDDALAEAVSHLATIADRTIQNTDRIESLEERAQKLRDETENPTDHSEDLRGFY